MNKPPDVFRLRIELANGAPNPAIQEMHVGARALTGTGVGPVIILPESQRTIQRLREQVDPPVPPVTEQEAPPNV